VVYFQWYSLITVIWLLFFQYPTGKCSPAEEKLLDFHRSTCDLVPQPVIPLEV